MFGSVHGEVLGTLQYASTVKQVGKEICLRPLSHYDRMARWVKEGRLIGLLVLHLCNCHSSSWWAFLTLRFCCVDDILKISHSQWRQKTYFDRGQCISTNLLCLSICKTPIAISKCHWLTQTIDRLLKHIGFSTRRCFDIFTKPKRHCNKMTNLTKELILKIWILFVLNQ